MNQHQGYQWDISKNLRRLQREATLSAYSTAYGRNRLYARNAATSSEVNRVLEVRNWEWDGKLMENRCDFGWDSVGFYGGLIWFNGDSMVI